MSTLVGMDVGIGDGDVVGICVVGVSVVGDIVGVIVVETVVGD